jgi:hypothetical protein
LNTASDISSLKVSKRLQRPHPLVRSVRTELKNARTDRYGRINLHQDSLIVSVAPASLSRALCFIDAFIKGAKIVGRAVRSAVNDRDCLPLTRNGGSIGFKLFEKSRQTRLSADQRQGVFGRVYARDPTGHFKFSILGNGGPGQSRWNDSENRSIEDLIQQIVLRADQILEEQPMWRQKLEEVEERLEERWRKQKREEEKAAEELKRRQVLEEQAQAWTRSQELAAYVTALERRAAARQLTPETEATFDEWVQHARAHVRRLEMQVMPAGVREAVTDPGEDA